MSLMYEVALGQNSAQPRKQFSILIPTYVGNMADNEYHYYYYSMILRAIVSLMYEVALGHSVLELCTA